jgi:hypothetical protein
MLATAVLGKSYKSLTSRENAKKELEKHLTPLLSEAYVNDTITLLTQIFEDATKIGITKKDALKEKMSAELGNRKLFKFAQSLLEEMIQSLEDRSIEIYIRPVTKDSEGFQQFLGNTLNDTATVMERALSDQPMWGIYFKEGDATLLVTPIIQLGDMLWVPACTCKIELDNGDELKPLDISRMVKPIMETAYAKGQDKGAVEVTGPKGGKYPCGQIYTPKKKDQYTQEEKKIELQNGYVLDLFVTKTPVKK